MLNTRNFGSVYTSVEITPVGHSISQTSQSMNSFGIAKQLLAVIVLDEIEKANSDSRSDPTGPFYTLLEPRSARQFKDEYAGLNVDASHVCGSRLPMIGTDCHRPCGVAFVSSKLPRRRAMKLRPWPSKYGDLSANIPGAPTDFPTEWMRRLLRDIRLAQQEALGLAALRTCLESGAEICFLPENIQWAGTTSRRAMGFVGR